MRAHTHTPTHARAQNTSASAHIHRHTLTHVRSAPPQAQFTTELVPEMVALLRPLLDGAVLPALQREPLPSLLLVPSFELHALPLEAYPGLASLPCVTRG